MNRLIVLLNVLFVLLTACAPTSLPLLTEEGSAPTSAPAVPKQTLAAVPTTAAFAGDYAIFSINVQDFAYPDKSAATVSRILALHEKYNVPVDFYLTTTILDWYESHAPDLLNKLKTSPLAGLAYHVRPPAPYYTDYDWLGLGKKSATEQFNTIMNYETHGLDLASGQPTTKAGGYKKLSDLTGGNALIASLQTDAAFAESSASVFKTLGAKFIVSHSGAPNLGDQRSGMYLRPEHYDLKLFEHVGKKASDAVDDAFKQARAARNARAPYFVGIKMHDNDFFADDSAWVTAFLRGPRKPPFDINRKSKLLSDADANAQWSLYEAALVSVAASKDRLRAVHSKDLLALIITQPTAAQPAPKAAQPTAALSKTTPPPAATPTQAAKSNAPLLYISGTMHIENKREVWPDPDKLIAFFQRATKTGMHWSIGADIDWLNGEPRAGEIIRATSAVGVQWDAHTHAITDRANAARKIEQLGGKVTGVVSGMTVGEIDQMRNPLSGSGGYTWTAQVLWGYSGLITGKGAHTLGNDDKSAGVWRPKSSAEYSVHDPNGNLVSVGGGTRLLKDAEDLAKKISAGGNYAPITSVTVMVLPKTLLAPETNENIDALEAWAARVGKISSVRWATIAETATAWVAAGGVPSRMEVK